IYLAVQEANLLAIVDTRNMIIERYVDLGITTHRADITADGKFEEAPEPLSFFREPDGINTTPCGKYLLTSDEGDTVPPVEGEAISSIHGGGRTISVFDAVNGELLGDTGGQIDRMAAKAGIYPDERSGIKGSEPETVVSFRFAGSLYAVVSLERADGVALVSLNDPRHPKVLQVGSMHAGKRGTFEPEGIAIWKVSGHEQAVYVYTADAETGTVTVFRVAEESHEH
ncbi:hypothetical protein KAI87_17460, partial [Myxococcota bacterium]|nr:hypothetical protein [Myxococcota bacterium]